MLKDQAAKDSQVSELCKLASEAATKLKLESDLKEQR